jgi:hypothetical protein
LKLLTLSLTVLCLTLATPAFAGIIFDDGPIDGTTNAFFIDGPGGTFFQQTISDGFVATGSGTASSLDFGIWVITGTTPTTVSWSLGTSAFGSDIASGTSALSFTFFSTTPFGFDVYAATVTGLSGSFSAGSSYWLTLGGAFDSGGNPAAWDVNNGPATCDFAVSGVPVGDCGAGGEAFTLNSSSSAVPEPGSIMMLGTGVLGLAGVLRRKISL